MYDEDDQAEDESAKKEAKMTKRRRASAMLGAPAQESLKERQARAKEAREQRRAYLTPICRYFLDIVADTLGMDINTVEEFILDSSQYVDLICEFVRKNGRKSLMFFYQELKPPPADEAGRIIPTKAGQTKALRIIVSDGLNVALEGQCIYFFKLKENHELTLKNVSDETVFGFIIIDPENPASLINQISIVLDKVYNNALKMNESFGKLPATADVEYVPEKKLLEDFDGFLHFLRVTEQNIKSQVKLEHYPVTNAFEKFKDLQECSALIKDSAKIEELEKIVHLWYKQIERVLAESEQIRREADDVGPMAEIEHWRNLASKFGSLFEQMKDHRVKFAIHTLQLAKCKFIKNWKELESKISDANNESQDNLNYLSTLEKYCSSLYSNNPATMIETIPNLLNTIRLINSISRYFNNTEKMSSLFLKVTNQMVSGCKKYITDDGLVKIWNLERSVLKKRIEVCIKVYNVYRSHFQKIKEEMEQTPEERQFEFSEMYIFGKFDSFCKRLQKILDVIQAVDIYSALSKSTIESLDKLAQKFNFFYNNFKKKTYDYLDHRKKEFEYDYEEFKKNLHELEIELNTFMETLLNKFTTSLQALKMLTRFENLKIPELKVNEKYRIIHKMYNNELQYVRKVYEMDKDDPPLSRGMPPVSGRIMWTRHLFHRINEPMLYLLNNSTVLNNPEWRPLIREFNLISKTLVRFEIMFHEAWVNHVDLVKEGLSAPLLILHPETYKTLINFDPFINQTIKETTSLAKMNLEVPELAKSLIFQQPKLLDTYTNLQVMLGKINNIKNKIPPSFLPLMEFALKKLDIALLPGLTTMSWNSLSLNSFFDGVQDATVNLEGILKHMDDIKSARIDEALIRISETLLVDIPDDYPISVEELLDRTQKCCISAAIDLENRTHRVEEAVNELIAMFLTESDIPVIMIGYSPIWTIPISQLRKDEDASHGEYKHDPSLELVHEECRNLFNLFKNKNLEALVQATRNSLDTIRRRVAMANVFGTRLNQNKKKNITGYMREEKPPPDVAPLLTSNISLVIPNLVMIPSVDEIQQGINKTAQIILEVSKRISQWGSQEKKPTIPSPESVPSVLASKSRNYYKMITDHKDISKLIMMLSSCVLEIRADANEVVQSYSIYHALWDINRETAIQEFIAKNPILAEFKEEILHYNNLESEIGEIPPSHRIGAVDLLTDNIKLALSVEAKAWKMQLGRQLNIIYRQKLEEISEFMNENSKKLQRPIKDLDDVRYAMACLDDIREQHLYIDMIMGPIEESYLLLQKFGIQVVKEEMDLVDTLRYSYEKLSKQAIVIQDELVQIQPKFKGALLNAVAVFRVDVDDISQDYVTRGPMEEGIAPREASDRLALFQARFEELWSKYETYSGGEELFGLPITDYPDLHKMKKELQLLQKLYGLYNQVMDSIDGYSDIPWVDVDIEKINQELLDFQNRCKRLPKGMKDWQAFLDLKKKIDDFSETCPLLELMANKAMKLRHWTRLEALTKHTFDVESENFLLKNIIEAPLLQYKDDVEDICISAVKEKDIEAKLKQVIAEWSIKSLTFATFKNRGELLLKGADISEIISALEDSLMILGSLLSNRYNAPFKKEIQLWVQKLSNTTDILTDWLTVQNLWVYLEAVFVGGDIAKQLPKEAKRFQNIDKSWIKIMSRAHEIPNVINCCVGDETMGQLLPHLLDQLEQCQKSLTGYLEAKRAVFPRFFFISDPALLEILGQASDSHSIQAHLAGVFENVNEVEFHEKDYDRITAFLSREKERIPLVRDVYARGNVELWLGDLLREQRIALNTVIREGYTALITPGFDLLNFLNEFPAQVALLGIQFIWTRDSEEALKNARTDKKIMPWTNQRFLDMLNKLIEQTTKDLKKFERVKYETLITIHVHQRDIFDELVKTHIKSPTDFEWLKQSRFYFDEDEDYCLVKITDIDFIYQNEYLGCTDRLVITPLTDRCYITLAQAIGMSMGGAPAGPAGTGKTETTKDMGKALGKYVVVFNCSDQMDFRGLGRIYKGLAQSGSWGCFDEFNRIELPVLSVAAQQIYIVLMARKERKAQFVFSDGDTVDLNPEFGLFITMNPGYAGRQELPENLKVLFRTVSMMVPDRQIIMRVKLASCGFIENIILAQKFYTLYKLCEEQLTKQVHYDFGLRNILSVLRTLGGEKRIRIGESESTIVMRVLRDMNLSKLVDEDEPLFISLISDLFPGIVLDSATYPDLQLAISHQVEEFGLVNHPAWNLKLVQLYETQRVRHGMMTLGPSGAGKTCCIHVLMKSMGEIGAPHREMRMNPKAITAPQMFGRLDVATNDWTDGIFSTLWRRSLKAKKGEHIWIVLDGPVDAVWIENLNSVLDDNKTLTLANGDRIPMGPNCKIVFEPDNIDNASPATVSRNGMVYMSSSGLDWRPILQGWLKTRTAQEAHVLWSLYDALFDDVFTYVHLNLNAKMKILECNYIRQDVKFMGTMWIGILAEYIPEYFIRIYSFLFITTNFGLNEKSIDLLEGLIPDKDEIGPVSALHLERLFIFAVMWSCGALLELDDRLKMEEFMKQHPSKPNTPKALKENETIFEFVVDNEGNWEHWSKRVVEYIYPNDSVPEYTNILIPNVDNVRTTFLMDTICKQTKAVLLIGEQGTAKTVMIKGYLAKYDPEYHMSKSCNFSSATTPLMFQRTIESYVDKRMGNTYGPPAGRKMTVFIDDINMPIINEWGDQVTNEIVRQLMQTGGFYNLEKPGDFTIIADVQFIAATIHPGGGRNDIPPRLKRQFSIFNCTLPSNNSIDVIFGIIGSGYFCDTRFKEEVVNFIKNLVPATRILWQQTKIKMLPTPAKFHYIFNLRDLSRIWQGMLKIKGEECADVKTLVNLWKHECTRVISDRFITDDDKLWFDEAVKRVIKSEMGEEILEFYREEPYFVNFLREAPEPTGEEEEEELEAPKIYELVPSFEQLSEKLYQYSQQFNELVRGQRMELVFFIDCMIHLVKVSRIITTTMGHALLVGVGGSGKQSLTKLASFIAGYQLFQITLTRTYNANNLIDDLKNLFRIAGQKGKGMTFIFTDNDIKDEGFLEYLNNVLSGGEVSSLFARDELDEIQSDLISVMKKEFPRRPPTQENLYDYFVSRTKANLHVVLCFSPVGEKFQLRSLKFPGLISGCTMDWFSKWPRDALVAVSDSYLSPFEIVCSPEMKQDLIEIMGEVHENVEELCSSYFERYRRATFVTPKSYLSFLNGYKNIYKEKHALIGELALRMNTGLSKLLEATESVAQLSKELEVKEKDLAIASAKADKVLEVVTQSAADATVVKNEVQKVKDKAQKIVDGIAVEKAYAEEKLEAAKPALAEAEAALQTIKAADISTVRKLGKPPHLIMRIMDCVILLFQKKIDSVTADPERVCPRPSWAESLKLMSGTGFLANLQNFPKDTINGETVELLAPYLDMEDYTFETAKKVCGNVAGLLSWTVAMAFFYGINKEVLPLKANLIVQEARLNGALQELNTAQGQLDEKQRELDKVQAMYDAAMTEKQDLLDDAEKCKTKMQTASALINGLAGERIRWTEQSKAFKSQIDRLIGDVLMLTGFLSYTGPFNQEFRQLCLRNWQHELNKRRIHYSADLNLTEMLADVATIGEWNLQGLPNDDLSIQNGIIVTKAPRYPLLIDPQGQGKIWITNKEKDNNLMVTSLNHKYFRNHVEDALSLGTPLLLEDIGEELDPALDNILEKNFIKSGTALKVKVGDKEIDLMKGFSLIITTKLPNPKYTPEISAKTSIIDFTVTMRGLEDQLLGRVILTEKAELEVERKKLLENVMANKRRMQELEDNLLYKLTSTEGSLVEDESLVSVLAITKETAAEVKEKLFIAAETEIKINVAREEFRPVASRGSTLYFLICEMSMVNVMYQTSLRQFLQIFDFSMARSEKSPLPIKRIGFIIECLTYEVFKYSCRGLYEQDKFMFTLLLALKIDMQKGFVKYEEFQTFIKGGAALDLNACPPKPARWITDITWLNLVELSKLPQFREILTQVQRGEKSWRNWFDKDAPEEEIMPDGYSTSLDTFRKLLLVRSWCPDRTIAQSRKYIADSLGKKYAEPVILNLEATFLESEKRVPLICLLSMGADPTQQIQDLAKKLQFTCPAISMGQGQEVHARRLVSQSMAVGGWVLLQNCHLGLEFMDELLDTLILTENYHQDFRVWITTEVHTRFPISLLQISIKFSNQPPEGMKAGLKRTFVGITQEQLDYSEASQWKPMLYAVSFLHSCVQERRKYGPLGWNIPYEFNTSDFTASVQFVMNHLDDMDPKKGVSWTTVRYMIGEVQYGGRVTDDYDKRLLNTYAKVWFGEHMFAETFTFYKEYKIPRCMNVAQYLQAIEALPDVDSPQVFGLHSNADITYQSNTAADMMDMIISIQPKESSAGAGESRETVVYRMADEMLHKLPPNYIPHEVRARLEKMGILNSLNIFLKQEIDRMQKIISLVRGTLTDLKLAIDGTIIMSENLRDALDKIFDAKVPDIWARTSWESTTIGFWFTELLERNDQFYRWIFQGRPNTFWMTGFFNPQGFLTAMRQEVARMHKGWALDTVTLHNEVTKYLKEEIIMQPAEGVYVYGLYLDGAAWDRKNGRLTEQSPKVMSVLLPVIHLFAINSTAPKDPKLYQCPVYKKPRRTDLTYVTPVWLKTVQPPEHWILRGVALLCDIK